MALKLGNFKIPNLFPFSRRSNEGVDASQLQKFISISSNQFTPANPDTDQVSRNGDYISADGEGITFYCDVQIPDGATIIATVVYGNGQASSGTYSLVRAGLTGTEISVLATGNISSPDQSINAAIIENRKYQYYFKTSSLSATSRIYSAVIWYSV